jgi:hypothetical protein
MVAHTVYGLTSDSKGTLYAERGNGGIYRSTDDGLTWINVSTFPRDVNSLVALNDDRLVVATNLSVWISEDSARTWKPFGAGLGSARDVRLVVHPDGSLYAIHGDGRIFVTIPDRR